MAEAVNAVIVYLMKSILILLLVAILQITINHLEYKKNMDLNIINLSSLKHVLEILKILIYQYF